MTYTAPIRDLTFAARIAGLDEVRQLPGFEEVTDELLQSILEEAGKFASEVLAPLNRPGDEQGARLIDGRARTADGWADAYKQFIDGGWNGLACDTQYGGQGLPWLAATAVAEIWHAANMSFSLCPLLTQSAIQAIQSHASEALKDVYLPKLVSGVWSGTMNLTEPQAGSDLAAVRARAVPAEGAGDGAYRITGQKIFITYGDHDMTENIIHLVLARTPDAPAGVKGISLFIVPKFLPDDAGEWVLPNAITTLALERKLGIHASPTAALGYGGGGDGEGALGFLVGEENRGLMYMFTMMNLARHAVGVEGNGVAERAYQQAAAFASERVQGVAVEDAGGGRVPIIRHPDVRRMLWLQKCRIEAVRSLALTMAAAMDKAAHAADEAARTAAREMVEILTPIVKGYATEMGLENVSLALQVHGGMGFIEETGAAQHYRDQRITPIYEGTTGIQAMDLAGRKLTRDAGAMTRRVIAVMRGDCARAAGVPAAMREGLAAALDELEAAAEFIVAAEDARVAGAVCEPYLRLWGVAACGWQMMLAADACAGGDDAFCRDKIRTAEFYFASEMPKVGWLAAVIRGSAGLVVEAGEEVFVVG